MKIAFTTTGDTLEAPLDSRFGRAPRFIIYDLEKDSFEVVDNRQNLNTAQGAGIQAAETIGRAKVNYLITGHCGPKAFRVLNAAGIAVYNCSEATVADALRAFREGILHSFDAADVEGHWI